MPQDWNDVYIKPKTTKKKTKTTTTTSGDDLVKKYTASKNTKPGVDAKKIEKQVDEGDGSLVHKELSKDISVRIQQARCAKKWTQKELAMKKRQQEEQLKLKEKKRREEMNKIQEEKEKKNKEKAEKEEKRLKDIERQKEQQHVIVNVNSEKDICLI